MRKDNTHFKFEPKILTLSQILESEDYKYPRFQRDLVWSPDDMIGLIESVYEGIPINSIYLWKRTGVILKDRSESDEKSLLVIDGQQRLTSLRAMLLGEPYGKEEKSIQIAFNPVKGTFHKVEKDEFTPGDEHIRDIARFYTKPEEEWEAFFSRNERKLNAEEREAAETHLERLEAIKEDYNIVVYYLSKDVDLDVAYKCFERVNQAGRRIKQTDLCMSWLETYQPLLAEGIVMFGEVIRGNSYKESKEFRLSKFSEPLNWLKEHEPASEPFRPKIGHIAELLFNVARSGKKFQIRSIAEQLLKAEETPIGINNATTKNGTLVEKAFLRLVDVNNYKNFNQILQPFSVTKLTETDKNYAYWLFLQCLETEKRNEDIARLLQRWHFLQLMSHMRKSGAAAFSQWMNDFTESGGLKGYLKSLEDELKPESWDTELPIKLSGGMDKNKRGKVLNAWTMVHVLRGESPLFDASVPLGTLRRRSEHHIYPLNGFTNEFKQGKIDAIANMAITTTKINSAIGDKPLHRYIAEESEAGRLRNLNQHLTAHCIPEETGEMEYDDFLAERAKMMAKRFRDAYLALKE